LRNFTFCVSALVKRFTGDQLFASSYYHFSCQFICLLTIFTVYESSKLTAVSQDRKRAEEMEFRKAGTGPIPKTYASDPTKTQKKRQSLSS